MELKEGFGSILSKLEPNSVQSIDFSAPVEIPFELYTNNQTKRIVQLSDEELEPLKNQKSLYQLILHNTTVTDKSMPFISEIESLRLLNLWNTKITDEGLTYLARLPFLDTVYLGATDITDEGLKYIGNLTQLRCLFLTSSNRQKGKNSATATFVNLNISDSGIYYLSPLISLEVLDISDTNVSDVSICILSQFHSLRYLDISGTKISKEGSEKLKKALPECQIVKDAGMVQR